MDLTKKTVHYTQEGKTVFDRFYLDEDYNVPEQKEAVKESCTAVPSLRQRMFVLWKTM